jgi:hypothetical protein
MSSTRWLLAVSDTIYRLLLVGYPVSFRKRYGSEMVQVFGDCTRDAWRCSGLWGLLRLWGSTLGDLLTTVLVEYWAVWQGDERSTIVDWNTGVQDHPFVERLAEVLDQKPSYYQLLISTEPTRSMSDLIDCLAIDGDWDRPEATLALFQKLRRDVPELEMDRWLGRLSDAARRIYVESSVEPSGLVDKIIRLIYADPHLYELVAAVEPGYGLLDLIENMALEVNLEEVEPALALMRELCREPLASGGGA